MLARLCRAYADAWHADRYAAPAELDDPSFDPRAGAAGYRTADGRSCHPADVDVIRGHDPGHDPTDDHAPDPHDPTCYQYGPDHDRWGQHVHGVTYHGDPPGAV